MFRHTNGHSKILGVSLDGYPIYGPYTIINNEVVKMKSSYRIKENIDELRINTYHPMGTFIEDYIYESGIGNLDEHNGTFCKTPEYPNGTYAYFITLDDSNNPEYPYIIGPTFKSDPSENIIMDDVNYEKNYNILPKIVSSDGFSKNESLYIGCGSGYNAECSIYYEGNTVKIKVIDSGFQYKQGDVTLLRRKSLPKNLEYYDDKRFLIKRKNRFENGLMYDYDNDILYLKDIKDNNIRSADEFSLLFETIITNGSIDLDILKDNFNEIYRISSTTSIIEQLMTVNKNTLSFFETFDDIDITENIMSINRISFFKDVFNAYIEKYKNDNFNYFYNDTFSYTKYSGKEYDLVNIDLSKFIDNVNSETIDLLKSTIDNKIDSIVSNNSNIINNQEELSQILNRPEKPVFSWVHNLGNYIIKKINLYFNELLIDSLDSDWVNIWNNISNIKSKEDSYNKMIGNYEELNSLDGKIKQSKTLYIPLKFWFCNVPGLNIPLIAMPYVDINLNFTFEDLSNLVRKSIGSEIIGDGKFKSSLIVNYIYLDQNERKLFAESRHEYLIEQIQTNSFENLYNGETTKNVLLSFKNCIKDIFYVIIKENNVLFRERSNYSLIDHKMNGGNPIKSTTLEFNGRDRFRNYSGFYTNYITPYEKYLSTPSDGINILSFSLDPNVFQPSGCCNFSMLEEPYLKLIVDSD